MEYVATYEMITQLLLLHPRVRLGMVSRAAFNVRTANIGQVTQLQWLGVTPRLLSKMCALRVFAKGDENLTQFLDHVTAGANQLHQCFGLPLVVRGSSLARHVVFVAGLLAKC